MPVSSRVPTVAQGSEPRLYTALLRPHRSLSPRGFTLLMTVIGVVSFGVGLAFLRMGAWPVMGIFGIDAFLILYAFRRNYHAARAFEEIDLTANRLLVRKVTAAGDATEHSFHPYWTKLEVDRRSWGIVAVALSAGGRRLDIGSFLSAPDRATLVTALSRGLAAARSQTVAIP